MNFIILFILFFLVVSLVLQLYSAGKNVNSVLALVVVFVFCGLITYSADYWAYKYYHVNNENAHMEPMFGYISNLFDKQNFTGLFRFYVFCYSFLLVWVIRIFYKNPLIIVLLYVPIIFVFYTAQIRFFMGYFPAILALYYFLHKKNNLVAALLFVFAILNHSSLYLLLLFIPYYKLKNSSLGKYTIYFSVLILIFFLLSFFVFKLDIGGESRVGLYTVSKRVSSFTGGIFYFFPYLILFLYINLLMQMRLKNDPDYLSDGNLKILYYLTIFPFTFLLISLFVQVIGHRFIVSAVLFAILLFFRMKPTFQEKIYFIIIIIFMYFYTFILPPMVIKDSNVPVMIKTIYSNEFFKNYFL